MNEKKKHPKDFCVSIGHIIYMQKIPLADKMFGWLIGWLCRRLMDLLADVNSKYIRM